MPLIPQYSANVMALVNTFTLAANELGVDFVTSLENNIGQDANQATAINGGNQAKYPRAWLRVSLTSDLKGFIGSTTLIERFNAMLVVAVSAVDTESKIKIKNYSDTEGYAEASALGKNLLATFQAIAEYQGKKLKIPDGTIGSILQRQHTNDSTAYRGDFRFAVEAYLDNPCLTIAKPFVPKPPFNTFTDARVPITDRDILKYE